MKKKPKTDPSEALKPGEECKLGCPACQHDFIFVYEPGMKGVEHFAPMVPKFCPSIARTSGTERLWRWRRGLTSGVSIHER